MNIFKVGDIIASPHFTVGFTAKIIRIENDTYICDFLWDARSETNYKNMHYKFTHPAFLIGKVINKSIERSHMPEWF